MKINTTKRIMLISVLTMLVMLLYASMNITKSQPISESYTVIIDSDDTDDKLEKTISTSSNKPGKLSEQNVETTTDMKYILQWTSGRNAPFVYMGKGRDIFIERKCPYTNCFVTSDRKYLGDITKYDVIAFSASEVIHMSKNSLPEKRSPHQKYAFATIESSDYYPVCSNKFDGFFNWTWTFRLDSEVKWGYLVVRDKDNNVVGPKKDMNWIKFEEMDPISDEYKRQLKTKTTAAAWFVSNCHSRSKREQFVKDLQRELKQYDLTVDVYGACGPLKCSRANEAACFDLIKEKYYFYLSFENSFSEDYATEKVLNAVQHDAVPIVYGGADYSRFLPEASYLNARELGAEDLAAKMNHLIKNLDEYYDYFRWKNHYTYYRKMDSVETDEYCLFCTTLNDQRLVKEHKVYQNFREWWDPPGRC